MRDHKQATLLLRDAIAELGHDKVESLLPPMMKILGGGHDTGCQVSIYRESDAGAIFIWSGSVWYSPSYEFNDRGKIFGIQPEVEFAAPAIEAFFVRVENALVEHRLRRIQERERRDQQMRAARTRAIESLRQELEGTATD